MRLPRVETSYGRVAGRRADGVDVFLGIPFAAPTGGANRFRAPRAPEPWTGVRDADAAGDAAPQVALDAGVLPGMEVGAQSEDCLSLNVYTPAADGGRRPVMVWIHGGAFAIGSGSQSIYDGRALARRGDVVVVTIHYRLGALGFLDLAARFGEEAAESSNLGLRDQLAALAWVRENIAAFGGDPDDVTLFGESAGAMSVGALLGCPAARGLFRRAILQSGAAHCVHAREDAARVLDRFLHELGETELAALRAAPLERILRAQLACTLAADELDVLLPFQPVAGDALLPRPPLDAVRDGSAAGVPMLIGTTTDEWSLFAFMDPGLPGLDEAGFAERVAARVGSEAALRVVEAYRKQAPAGAPSDHFVALETDFVFRVPALRLADAQSRHAPVYVYEFAWRSPAQDASLGACHALDLPFVFDSLATPGMADFAGAGPDAEALRDAVMDAWLGFARGAHPGGAPASDWPRHDAASRPTLVFDRALRVGRAPREETFRVWEGLR